MDEEEQRRGGGNARSNLVKLPLRLTVRTLQAAITVRSGRVAGPRLNGLGCASASRDIETVIGRGMADEREGYLEEKSKRPRRRERAEGRSRETSDSEQLHREQE